MKRKTIMSSLVVSTVAVGLTSYFLKQYIKKAEKSLPIHKAGNPSPEDIEDNKMVSEGSTYPVQYYDQQKK
ncbi:hypothetical protein [Bacillus changyiensis]|uniref:hypothetical protein n=1 Tax=Bacillus changyiensis TaxID=3004103 RepID=UPI0022E2587B|nr:hypothetical protein [Bacillus changyiensis]MDA1478051.1 hypothetical protein [Bacillus changyiensis]